METSEKVLIVLGVAAAALVVVGIVAEAKAAPPPPPAPPPPVQTLHAGHRYSLSGECPFPIPMLPVAGDPTVALFLGIDAASVVSYSPAADSRSFTMVFDYNGPDLQLPAIQSGGGTACTSDLHDLGAAPVGGTFRQSQAVTVAWGQASAAQASGTAIVTAPDPILQVDMGGTGTALTSGKTATLTFNGNRGTVVVYGNVLQLQRATVTVA